MANCVLAGGVVLTLDEAGTLLEDGAVAVERDRIVDVGPAQAVRARHPGKEVIDAKGRVILPGLVNVHNHLFGLTIRYMNLSMEGIDPLDYGAALTRWWWRKVEETATQEDAYYGTLLGCAEMLERGITTSADTLETPNALPNCLDRVAQAFTEVGMRGVLCFEASERLGAEFGVRGLEENLRFIRRVEAERPALLKGTLGVHTPFSSSPAYLKKVREAADKVGEGIQIHIAQSRYERDFIAKHHKYPGPVVMLKELGFLGRDVLAAHCIYLEDRELDMMAEKGVHVSFNVKSNERAANGVAPITRCWERGINVALGLDGVNVLDMFELMLHASYLLRVANLDRRILNGEGCLRMATVNGAKALGMEKEIGTIEVGKKADIIMIDTRNKLHLAPCFNWYEAIGHGARGSDVEWVMVNGEVVKEDYRLKTVDAGDLITRCREQAIRYKERIDKTEVAPVFELETLRGG
ncbi:MAG: amidohydrolase [Candidatus Tectomicrobia bacterium]|nr:amidohydrolase [Candidatus Tectomicrobia bacterium]